MSEPTDRSEEASVTIPKDDLADLLAQLLTCASDFSWSENVDRRSVMDIAEQYDIKLVWNDEHGHYGGVQKEVK